MNSHHRKLNSLRTLENPWLMCHRRCRNSAWKFPPHSTSHLRTVTAILLYSILLHRPYAHEPLHTETHNPSRHFAAYAGVTSISERVSERQPHKSSTADVCRVYSW